MKGCSGGINHTSGGGGMIAVTLTEWEVAVGGFVGVLRQSESIRRKLKSKAVSESPFQISVEGALGEMAVAKALNRFWCCGVNSFKKADIGIDIQVRCRSRPDGELIVRPNDNEDHYYVLVTGQAPTYTVHGFLQGKEAQRDEWVKNPFGKGEAWFCPLQSLHPISELPAP